MDAPSCGREEKNQESCGCTQSKNSGSGDSPPTRDACQTVFSCLHRTETLLLSSSLVMADAQPR